MEIFIISLILLSISIFLFIKTKKKADNNQQLEAKEREWNLKIAQLNKEYNDKSKNLDELNEKFTQWGETIEDAMTQYVDLLETKYEKEEQAYDNALDLLKTAYDVEQDRLVKERDVWKADLDTIRSTRAATIKAMLREKELDKNKDFYTLSIDVYDKREIDVIKSIEGMIRDPRSLRMLIWSSYYLKKANELCANVLGPNKKTGIYKITSLIDGRCYIGQAIDIKERWRDHMKAGLGIDAPATKFYEVMQEQGIENFTFELLEECSKDLLNEKEMFYIDLYQSLDYGFNSTRGNKKS